MPQLYVSVSESNLTSIIGQIVSFKCASKASSASSSKALNLLVVEDPSTPAELLAAEKKSKYTFKPKTSDTFASDCRKMAFFESSKKILEE